MSSFLYGLTLLYYMLIFVCQWNNILFCLSEWITWCWMNSLLHTGTKVFVLCKEQFYFHWTRWPFLFRITIAFSEIVIFSGVPWKPNSIILGNYINRQFILGVVDVWKSDWIWFSNWKDGIKFCSPFALRHCNSLAVYLFTELFSSLRYILFTYLLSYIVYSIFISKVSFFPFSSDDLLLF